MPARSNYSATLHSWSCDSTNVLIANLIVYLQRWDQQHHQLVGHRHHHWNHVVPPLIQVTCHVNVIHTWIHTLDLCRFPKWSFSSSHFARHSTASCASKKFSLLGISHSEDILDVARSWNSLSSFPTYFVASFPALRIRSGNENKPTCDFFVRMRSYLKVAVLQCGIVSWIQCFMVS